jgi:aryl-alcohol dehydrogenase-like predicted oxidoreductase
MRYRPFGSSGFVVSSLSLGLFEDPARTRPEQWTKYVYAALEHGINTFEIRGRSPAIADGLAQALQTVDRSLVFVIWRIGRLPPGAAPVRDFSAAAINGQIRSILARTGLGHIDVAMLDDPGETELPPDGLDALLELKSAGAVHFVGVSGTDDTAIDAYISTGRFDAIGASFNLTSGWRERNRVRAAVQRDMVVVGYDPYPAEFHRAVTEALKKGKGLFGRGRSPLDGVGTYAFLDTTPNWSGEQICLAYAVTEPALATVQVAAPPIEKLDDLVAAVDRELPPGLSAQIEMARFGPTPEPKSA